MVAIILKILFKPPILILFLDFILDYIEISSYKLFWITYLIVLAELELVWRAEKKILYFPLEVMCNTQNPEVCE